MINSNQPKIAIFAVAMAILGSAALVANPGRMAYARENATNATGVTGVLTITKYVESLMNALKAKYPKLAALTGAEDRDLIGTLKELKDAKETAKTIVAANILRDLIQYKALENMQ